MKKFLFLVLLCLHSASAYALYFDALEEARIQLIVQVNSEAYIARMVSSYTGGLIYTFEIAKEIIERVRPNSNPTPFDLISFSSDWLSQLSSEAYTRCWIQQLKDPSSNSWFEAQSILAHQLENMSVYDAFLDVLGSSENETLRVAVMYQLSKGCLRLPPFIIRILHGKIQDPNHWVALIAQAGEESWKQKSDQPIQLLIRMLADSQNDFLLRLVQNDLTRQLEAIPGR